MGFANRLGSCWRLFATGLSFAVFGLGGVLLSLTLFPAIRLVSRSRDLQRRRIQRAMHRVFRLFIWQMRLLGVMTYEVDGAGRLLRPGALIVANHPSLIDVVLLIALIPEVDCIVKRGLWRNPFLRWPVAWADYIPNQGSAQDLVQDAAANLRRGRSLIVFPEGTRSVPGQPLAMHRGAARIAIAADAPIVPVSIRCTPPTLTKAQAWYRIPPRRPHWRISVGEAVLPAAFAPAGAPPSMMARRLTQHFVDHFSQAAAAPAAERAAADMMAACTSH
ncbi:MAG: 1-acyl-sn-glycerol-3-phosphate acyltransferase [Nevskia sp.]|nr:1-acyl-sn-glycerol-3-phosphate acyltransferase [Nevskia sp.]